MDLSDEFEVPLSLEEAWSVLTDLERVAPCLPGAQLDEVDGEEYRGRVRVKVGPITVEYRGAAHFVAREAEHHVAQLRAEGRETRGQGSAAATVRATLTEAGTGRTRVAVDTSLDVSGRVAQLGRGALADVSTRLLRQFVDNLERDLAAGASPAAGVAPVAEAPETGAPEAPGASRGVERRPAEPASALRLVGPALLKRLSPLVALGVLALALARVRRRLRRD